MINDSGEAVVGTAIAVTALSSTAVAMTAVSTDAVNNVQFAGTILTIISIIVTGGTWFIRRLHRKLKEEIKEIVSYSTKPIQPDTNGGLSLTDVHRKLDAAISDITTLTARQTLIANAVQESLKSSESAATSVRSMETLYREEIIELKRATRLLANIVASNQDAMVSGRYDEVKPFRVEDII